MKNNSKNKIEEFLENEKDLINKKDKIKIINSLKKLNVFGETLNEFVLNKLIELDFVPERKNLEIDDLEKIKKIFKFKNIDPELKKNIKNSISEKNDKRKFFSSKKINSPSLRLQTTPSSILSNNFENKIELLNLDKMIRKYRNEKDSFEMNLIKKINKLNIILLKEKLPNVFTIWNKTFKNKKQKQDFLEKAREILKRDIGKKNFSEDALLLYAIYSKAYMYREWIKKKRNLKNNSKAL